MSLLSFIPASPDGDHLLQGFVAYLEERGVDPYPAQEEAFLELFDDHHVILNTPTGSGKSLVALAMHFMALSRKQQCVYTAPIKALVSEKFFELCDALGAQNVGMMTGDASVNADAPIVCCTAEVLSNMALRLGDSAPVHHVVVDEFHYYSDPDRGAAWQIPLLTLPQAQFLLMSATLGNVERFKRELQRRTQRPCTVISSVTRPVPLTFEYAETPLQSTVERLVEEQKAPVYVVHFTQRGASEQAQAFTSLNFLTKDERRDLRETIDQEVFDSPFGKDLKRCLGHGIGVHHAGMLPKYRRLVEKLAQRSALRIICGTDTLGVGVNVPIRTVLFTQLCKFDGRQTAILSVRDFKQIAGRAGRKGFDDEGTVVAQAPEHVIENRILEQKAGDDPKRRRKIVRRSPPERGYAPWDKGTFERLQIADPEPLTSRFKVDHALILNTLWSPSTGCTRLKQLIRDSHTSKKEKRSHGRHAIALFRSLQQADVLTLQQGEVRWNRDLQEDFSLNHGLSPWLLWALPQLDPDDADHALNVLTLVESILEDPAVILRKQVDKLKTEALVELKEKGIEYEERMTILEALEHPKPCREFIYDSFNEFRESQPWVGENIRPKSVAREMMERGLGFNDYVREYGIMRSEGVLIRHLTNAYKTMRQSVPESLKTESLHNLEQDLETLVRKVDSSLLDEWLTLTSVTQRQHR